MWMLGNNQGQQKEEQLPYSTMDPAKYVPTANKELDLYPIVELTS